MNLRTIRMFLAALREAFWREKQIRTIRDIGKAYAQAGWDYSHARADFKRRMDSGESVTGILKAIQTLRMDAK